MPAATRRPRSSPPRTLAVVAALFAVLAAGAAPAAAAPPTPKSKAIVPVVSIGGMKLGLTYETALKRWGAGSTCVMSDDPAPAESALQTTPPDPLQTAPDRSQFTGVCSWRVDETDPEAGGASVIFERGRVNEASLRCARDPGSGEPTGRGPIGRFKLRRGNVRIGCGTSIAKLRRTYPQADPTLSGAALFQRDRMLSFGADAGEIAGVALLYAKNF